MGNTFLGNKFDDRFCRIQTLSHVAVIGFSLQSIKNIKYNIIKLFLFKDLILIGCKKTKVVFKIL